MNLPLCIFKWGAIDVPADTGEWTNPKHRKLIAEVKAEGNFHALGMHVDSMGIWFGFQIDEHPFIVVHNGACLQAMGLIGAAGIGMPCWIPAMDGPKNLTLAYNKPFYFGHKLQLFMGCSDKTTKHVDAVHLYFDADPSGIKFSENFHPNWIVK